ncbi:hypothetical protein [Xanthomonas sp. MUS 060]|uniref:hypothetical protein n=1 Tax=Xanthomonas sp. MUS 060 TaxID=1588031 RepID=UPI0005F2D73A|nr:hypothetical protein [Xanthomonas sp. MUS 060]
MALTDANLVDIRRYCGYPAYGPGAEGFQSWRFFQAYGLLEYRLKNITPDEQAVVLNYLGSLATMEAAIPGVGANLDTDQAAVWTHNKRELRDRMALYRSWRRELCAFLGVPPGPNLGDGGLALVV